MNYCPNCGAKLPEGAGRCPVCGYWLYPAAPVPAVYAGAPAAEKKKSGLRLAAFVLCVISTIGIGWLLIPLLWCIPLTARVYRAYTGERAMSDTVAVCVLLFLNLIAGILLLADQ